MIKYRKIFYTVSSIFVILSIGSLAFFGLQLGIDFKGGSLMELQFNANDEGIVYVPTKESLTEALGEFEVGSVQIQEISSTSFLLRFADVDEPTHQSILQKIRDLNTPPVDESDGASEEIDDGVQQATISEDGVVELEVGEEEYERLTGQQIVHQELVSEERFESVGPIIGQETIKKSLQAIALVLILIVGYIAWAFRKVSYPVSSFKYGVAAFIALLHDILITVGIFSVIAYFAGFEVGVPFIAALLTILGYSVNDTIVIFDRIRENLIKSRASKSFEVIVSRSVSESLMRSVNSSLTTLFVLLAVILFGGASLYTFVLVLIIGIIVGTYSSLFVASPLLVSWVGGKK